MESFMLVQSGHRGGGGGGGLSPACSLCGVSTAAAIAPTDTHHLAHSVAVAGYSSPCGVRAAPYPRAWAGWRRGWGGRGRARGRLSTPQVHTAPCQHEMCRAGWLAGWSVSVSLSVLSDILYTMPTLSMHTQRTFRKFDSSCG